jgi:hypothetical protein
MVDITQREMLPLSPQGRRLIVIHRNSVMETFSLDHSFGGNQDRAIVEYSALRETLQELLGTSACEGKKWFVVNGMKTGFDLLKFTNARNQIRFHHSLIVAVCSEKRHSMAGRSFHCPTDTKDVSSTDVNMTGPQKTIDLHTATSLIGRLDGLDMSLGDLRLHEYAINGVLTLYTVVRTYRHGDTHASVGKEEIFRFRSSWVIPLRIMLTSRKSQVLRAKR